MANQSTLQNAEAPVKPETPDAATELTTEINEIETSMQALAVSLVALTKRLKKMEKTVHTLLKQKNKKQKTQKKEVPVKIDARLIKFMSLSEPLTTRSEALRSISEYVRKNKLQVPDDKRTFTTDDTLAKLLNIPKGQKLTFLAINKYITPLFATSKKVEPPAAPPVKESSSKKKKAVASE